MASILDLLDGARQKCRGGLGERIWMSYFLTGLRPFLALALVLGALPSKAGIFYRDDRESLQPKMGEPLARVGVLSHPDRDGRGTAFLVGRCHILTNFHVAQGEAPSHFTLLSETPVEAVIVAAGRYNPQARVGANEEDWALMKLSVCLGEAYGWFELETLTHENVMNENLVLAGYPGDRMTDSLTLDPQCLVHPETIPNRGGWRHDCASRAGSSGGPLLAKRGNDYRVVALNVTERARFDEVVKYYHVNFSNGAIPVSVFSKRVQAALKAHSRAEVLNESR